MLKTFPDNFVDCCVTSPPYWGLRDYGVDGQLGLEKTPEEYVANMVKVFREVRRVLRDDGTLWLNLGDSYAGSGGAHKEGHANPGLSQSWKRDGVPPTREELLKQKGIQRNANHSGSPTIQIQEPSAADIALAKRIIAQRAATSV